MPRTTPQVFVSASPFDLKHERGHLRFLLQRLADEVDEVSSRKVEWLFDRSELSPATPWSKELSRQLRRTNCLVAVLTPKFLKSSWCRSEVRAYLKRPGAARGTGRILPILYLGDDVRLRDGIRKLRLESHQALDWRDLRFAPLSSAKAHRKLREAAEMIAKGLDG